MRGQGVALIVVLVVLGFALFSPWAFLVRYDPLYVNDEAAVENLACSYSTGVRSATIFFIGYKHGADCPGSISSVPSLTVPAEPIFPMASASGHRG